MRMGQITAENYQAYSQLFNGGKTKAAGKSGAGIADLSAWVGASFTGKARGADTVSLSKNLASGGAILSGKVPTKALTSGGDPFYYRNRFTPAVFDKQGGGATLAYYQSNPAQTKDWELQKIQKPDWSQILLPPKQPVMSEDEYVAAIKGQARRDFAEGACANTESFSNLWKTYVSEVSPDRQAIYAESMRKTGGYMNLGAAFFADDGQMVMMYTHGELFFGKRLLWC
ncbi:hypothetical protein FACS1894139_17960 [Planctomycetales bacterium]|nr:hypothetical protein FACS1894107_15080 [Planctomycetales bacterium]GHT00613.1 hypothetical protein FACS1894108_13080 [Planctomycetales bacterium]GHT08362.1 hypothetical protein FACS1894139_17960 [Planctomycetales bacterium]